MWITLSEILLSFPSIDGTFTAILVVFETLWGILSERNVVGKVKIDVVIVILFISQVWLGIFCNRYGEEASETAVVFTTSTVFTLMAWIPTPSVEMGRTIDTTPTIFYSYNFLDSVILTLCVLCHY